MTPLTNETAASRIKPIAPVQPKPNAPTPRMKQMVDMLAKMAIIAPSAVTISDIDQNVWHKLYNDKIDIELKNGDLDTAYELATDARNLSIALEQNISLSLWEKDIVTLDELNKALDDEKEKDSAVRFIGSLANTPIQLSQKFHVIRKNNTEHARKSTLLDEAIKHVAHNLITHLIIHQNVSIQIAHFGMLVEAICKSGGGNDQAKSMKALEMLFNRYAVVLTEPISEFIGLRQNNTKNSPNAAEVGIYIDDKPDMSSLFKFIRMVLQTTCKINGEYVSIQVLDHIIRLTDVQTMSSLLNTIVKDNTMFEAFLLDIAYYDTDLDYASEMLTYLTKSKLECRLIHFTSNVYGHGHPIQRYEEVYKKIIARLNVMALGNITWNWANLPRPHYSSIGNYGANYRIGLKLLEGILTAFSKWKGLQHGGKRTGNKKSLGYIKTSDTHRGRVVYAKGKRLYVRRKSKLTGLFVYRPI